VTVTGLVPPRVPALTFTDETDPALLKRMTPPDPVIPNVAPVKLHPDERVATPAETFNVVPVPNVPLALRVAPPLRLTLPAPLTSELAPRT
jgi:hypothetical protein